MTHPESERTIIVDRAQLAKGYQVSVPALDPRGLLRPVYRPYTVVRVLADGRYEVLDPYADIPGTAEVRLESTTSWVGPDAEPATRTNREDLQMVQLLARQYQARGLGFGMKPPDQPETGAGEPVRHTGVFEYRSVLARLQYDNLARADGPDPLDERHRHDAVVNLGPPLLDALGDGRPYRVTMRTGGRLGPETVERWTWAVVLLVDPRDAEVGEAVWRDPERSGRPNFVYSVLSGTVWELAPGAWIRRDRGTRVVRQGE